MLAELGAVPPADREALTALGALHRARGDRPATLAALQLLVAATPPAERVEALVALARHLDDTPGAAAEALATWEAARALRPDHPVVVEALITRHADAGRADAAIALLRERLRRADDPLPDLRRLAALQREAGPRDASVETEREILAIAPADPAALANVAEWLAAGRRWPELITLHRAARSPPIPPPTRATASRSPRCSSITSPRPTRRSRPSPPAPTRAGATPACSTSPIGRSPRAPTASGCSPRSPRRPAPRPRASIRRRCWRASARGLRSALAASPASGLGGARRVARRSIRRDPPDRASPPPSRSPTASASRCPPPRS
ncbi:MAG: hypothetical protein H6703_00360 [Myxococcales bacterium]|nr:hypothetical protein [Myxococcales bacterium]